MKEHSDLEMVVVPDEIVFGVIYVLTQTEQ